MPTSALPPQNATSNKPNGTSTSPKRERRFLRRRGRGRAELSDEDEEVEREALTDSDFSSQSTESVHDSDEEDGEPPSHPSLVSSDVPGAKARSVRSAAPSPSSITARLNGHNSFIPPASDIWSEMVLDEPGGARSADIPTIEFDQMGSQEEAIPSEETKAPKRKNRRKDAKSKKGKTMTTSSDVPEPAEPSPSAPTKHSAPDDAATPVPRPPKVDPRQVYRERLSNDPSFVPRFGTFWGHDERLIDKDLRSMSGWWRGRWQGRGRGNFGSRGRGRGRGGISGPRWGDGAVGTGVNGDVNGRMDSASIPPVEQSWKHDGFEELDKDEKRPSRRRFSGLRVVPRRGRGAFGRAVGALPTPEPTPTKSERTASPKLTQTTPAKHPKPERAWTKPLDKTIVAGSQSRPRGGSNSTDVRIKLSSGEPQHVSLSPQPVRNRSHSRLADAVELRSETSSSDKAAVVRLPGNHVQNPSQPELDGKPLQGILSQLHTACEPEPVTTESSGPPIPNVGLPPTDPGIQTRMGAETSKADFPILEPGPATDSSEPEPTSVDLSLNSESVHSHQNDVAPPSQPSSPIEAPPSHSYPESRYSPYPAPLPLPAGVAIGENGVLFEIATGRPVILTPSPQPVYDPRSAAYYTPVPHSYHHTHSLTPDFIPPSVSTPPVPPGVHAGHFGYSGYDTPQYSSHAGEGAREIASPFAPVRRQSRAVEIRAPADTSDVNGEGTTSPDHRPTTPNSHVLTAGKGKAPSRPSNLRSSVSADTPAPVSKDTPLVYQPEIQMMQPYPGAPFYPVAYPEYSPMHQYPPDGQPYSYYAPEVPYGGYPVPGQIDGGVDYRYSQYSTGMYPVPQSQSLYY